MRENRTCSLCGGRWPARKRATSDPTPEKSPNKGEQAPAEGMEGRRPTKENIGQATPPRTQSRTSELSDLRGVREVANVLQRQVSEVGAVCSNSARTDLCGGRRVNRRPYRDKSEVVGQICFSLGAGASLYGAESKFLSGAGL